MAGRGALNEIHPGQPRQGACNTVGRARGLVDGAGTCKIQVLAETWNERTHATVQRLARATHWRDRGRSLANAWDAPPDTVQVGADFRQAVAAAWTDFGRFAVDRVVRWPSSHGTRAGCSLFHSASAPRPTR